jgi:predicted ATP-grasp superfamily ATP-dependent carboligase
MSTHIESLSPAGVERQTLYDRPGTMPHHQRRSSLATRGETVLNPGRLSAIVLDSEFRQALATIRSFGRAGFAVGTVVCESRRKEALAHRSRWCRYGGTLPDFDVDPDAYVEALLALLDRQPTDLVVPCHDGSIEAIRRHREAVERRAALALASEAALAIAVDKGRTLALAAELGIGVPLTFPARDRSDLRQALDAVGLPAVIKPVTSWVHQGSTGTRLSCELVSSIEEATKALERIQAAGGAVVVQQWLSGRRDAVTFMYANGQVMARFAQTSYRELPSVGGASVLCESIPLTPDIVTPAEQLVRAMDLEGCSMVEFRRDRLGRPVLMEVNPRMPGSVALAIAAGIDFPQMLRAWALGLPVPAVHSYRSGVRRRWLAGDIDHLMSSLKTGRTPEVSSRLQTVGRFLGDFFVRPSTLDVLAADDLSPALIELRHPIQSTLNSITRFRQRRSERRQDHRERQS